MGTGFGQCVTISRSKINWQQRQEDVSRSAHLKAQQKTSPDLTITTSGLVVNSDNLWLEASPDGLVFDPKKDSSEGLVEFKKLYSRSCYLLYDILFKPH